MKQIKRNVKFYVTKAKKVKEVNGQLTSEVLPDFETTKKLSKVAIEKHFKALCNENESAIIQPTQELEKTFTMDLDNFIANAKENQ